MIHYKLMNKTLLKVKQFDSLQPLPLVNAHLIPYHFLARRYTFAFSFPSLPQWICLNVAKCARAKKRLYSTTRAQSAWTTRMMPVWVRGDQVCALHADSHIVVHVKL